MSLYTMDPGVFAQDRIPIVSAPAKKILSPLSSSPLTPATAYSEKLSSLLLAKLEPAANAIATPTTTPSVIEDLLNHIRLCAAGQSSAEGLLVFNLAAGDFEYLQEILSQDKRLSGFFYDKIIYDYDYHTHIFTTRMPDHVYEWVLSRIVTSFSMQLDKLTKDQDNYVAQAAKKVAWASSWECYWGGKYGIELHQPDAAWICPGARIPNVILEISYSQTTRDLEALAIFYIVGSRGKVNKVVGIDISYGLGKKLATFSVWEPKRILKDSRNTLTCHKVVDSQVIRDELGNAIKDPEDVLGLELTLEDFGNNNGFKKTLTQTIKISLANLHTYLHDAECNSKSAEAAEEPYILDKEGVDQDFGRSPPVETLLSEDEQDFKDIEHRVKKLYKKEDNTYRSQKRKAREVLSEDELAQHPIRNQAKLARSAKDSALRNFGNMEEGLDERCG